MLARMDHRQSELLRRALLDGACDEDLSAAEFAANHGCEFDASDAVAAIIVRVEQTITTLDRLCLEASQ